MFEDQYTQSMPLAKGAHEINLKVRSAEMNATLTNLVLHEIEKRALSKRPTSKDLLGRLVFGLRTLLF